VACPLNLARRGEFWETGSAVTAAGSAAWSRVEGRAVSPESPWGRFLVGLVLTAIAIRLVVDLIRPTLPYLAAVLVLVGAVQLARWWRDRW
jgi:hypothetical protein